MHTHMMSISCFILLIVSHLNLKIAKEKTLHNCEKKNNPTESKDFPFYILP